MNKFEYLELVTLLLGTEWAWRGGQPPEKGLLKYRPLGDDARSLAAPLRALRVEH